MGSTHKGSSYRNSLYNMINIDIIVVNIGSTNILLHVKKESNSPVLQSLQFKQNFVL